MITSEHWGGAGSALLAAALTRWPTGEPLPTVLLVAIGVACLSTSLMMFLWKKRPVEPN